MDRSSSSRQCAQVCTALDAVLSRAVAHAGTDARPERPVWREGLESRAGRWFADAARAEVSSAAVFATRLVVMRQAGAPLRLLADLQRSVRLERQHAHAMGELAARHGLEVDMVPSTVPAAMTLPRLAAENAVDGWVRTTWAAAKARHQARHATDVEVRVVMRAVAADEAQHASLAFRMHAWLVERLSAADRDLVADVARWSIAKLRASRRGPTLGYHRALGLPGEDASARILDVLETDLWAAA